MLKYHNIQDIKVKLTAMKQKSMEVEKAVVDKKPAATAVLDGVKIPMLVLETSY